MVDNEIFTNMEDKALDVSHLFNGIEDFLDISIGLFTSIQSDWDLFQSRCKVEKSIDNLSGIRVIFKFINSFFEVLSSGNEIINTCFKV